MNNTILFTMLGVVAFISIMVLVLIKGRKQVIKDWETLEDLEKRVEEISTLDELIQFHLEFVDKASKIHNQFIQTRLATINGKCKGMYKILTLQNENKS